MNLPGKIKVAILESGGANYASIVEALNRHGVDSFITGQAQDIAQASHVILAGVGSASAAMQYIEKFDLAHSIKKLDKPVLGICLGMQILGLHSEEHNTNCLGIIPLKTKALKPQAQQPVPHMGWNHLHHQKDHKIFPQSLSGKDLYFTHSFAMEYDPRWTIASYDYLGTWTGILAYENFMGCQFHPEKSGQTGHHLIGAFLSL